MCIWDYSKTSEHILINFPLNVAHGTMKKTWDFGGDSNLDVDPGIFKVYFENAESSSYSHIQ